MKPMSPEALLKSYGIKVVFDYDGNVRYQKLGSPLARACLVRDRQTLEVLVVAPRREIVAAHDILHEGVHALCGPSSFRSETALMYLQWVLVKDLSAVYLREVREYMQKHYIFADYNSEPAFVEGTLVWTGRRTKDLDASMAHPHYHAAAIEQGVAAPSGGPLVFGPHPDWASYQLPTPWEGPPDPWDSATW